MIRLLLFLLGKRGYESCKGCEILKEQLERADNINERLESTIIDLVKPRVVEVPAREVNEIKKPALTWSARRAALEANDRREAEMRRNSPHVAREFKIPNSIPITPPTIRDDSTTQTVSPSKSTEELEQELGVDENAKQ